MHLNQSQKIILGVTAAAVIGLVLYVPWTYTLVGENVRRDRPAGYALVFDPPPPEKAHNAYGVKLDAGRAFISIVGAVIAGGIATAIAGSRPPEKESHP